MSEIIKYELKAIEPTDILPPAVDGTYGAVMRHRQKNVSAEVLDTSVPIPPVREWHPSVFMRRLGYTRNPDICRHAVKGFTPRDGWWCKECGESL